MSKARRLPAAATEPEHRRERRGGSPLWRWLGGLTILLVGFYAFAPGPSGEFLWDDHSEIVANREIKGGLDGLRKIWVGEGTLDHFPLKSTVQCFRWCCCCTPGGGADG